MRRRRGGAPDGITEKPRVTTHRPSRPSDTHAVSGERLHGAIAREIGVAIVSGDHAPGAILENEVSASERLAVSRSAYREAIRMLAAKGLVESRPKTGTRVSVMSRWNLLDTEVLAWIFQGGSPKPELVRGLFELRSIVEPAAAALAAERRDAEDLSRMRKALQAMERHGVAVEAGRNADREFHDSVLAATRNPPLISLSSSIGAAVRWTTVFKQRRRALPRDPMPEHWRVFDAIAAGVPEPARIAMSALVAQALEDTRAEIES
jgi:DNA-binding FadR family transcriptional regulator